MREFILSWTNPLGILKLYLNTWMSGFNYPTLAISLEIRRNGNTGKPFCFPISRSIPICICRSFLLSSKIKTASGQYASLRLANKKGNNLAHSSHPAYHAQVYLFHILQCDLALSEFSLTKRQSPLQWKVRKAPYSSPEELPDIWPKTHTLTWEAF